MCCWETQIGKDGTPIQCLTIFHNVDLLYPGCQPLIWCVGYTAAVGSSESLGGQGLRMPGPFCQLLFYNEHSIVPDQRREYVCPQPCGSIQTYPSHARSSCIPSRADHRVRPVDQSIRERPVRSGRVHCHACPIRGGQQCRRFTTNRSRHTTSSRGGVYPPGDTCPGRNLRLRDTGERPGVHPPDHTAGKVRWCRMSHSSES